MSTARRIIDANANRAREALRVMEDAARFTLDDAELSAALKSLRHRLAEALAPLGDLTPHRDTPGDVGTAITTDAEQARTGVRGVAVAAGKRLSEALRSIEEYAKTLPGGAATAAAVERLRYAGYTAEQQLVARFPGRPAPQWRLCVLLTESLCGPRPWRDVLAAALAGGADCIQVRDKRLPAAALLGRVRETIDICRGRAAVVVNDRPDVARAAGADGVHLGQHDLPAADARRLVGDGLLIGVSTSRLDQARAALAAGADYCGVGPMYPTTTVDDKPDIAGPDYLRAYTGWGRLPHLAIGGITPGNLAPLVEAGARGVAVSATVCRADDPEAVCRQMLEIIPPTADNAENDQARAPW